MQTLLVPVDLSPTSGAALAVATYLASSLDLELQVVHVFDPLQDVAHTLFADERGDEKQRLQRALDDFYQKETEAVRAAFRGRRASLPVVRTEVLEGIPAATITGLSQREGLALVVMGGVGTSAGNRPPGIFGSVAKHVATQSSVPVILLPQTFRFSAIEQIAVAFEEPEELRLEAPFLRKLIGGLRCEVRYVHVRDADDKREQQREEDFVDMSFAAGFPSYTYAFDRLPAGDVVERLLAYTLERSVGLLVLGRRKRSFFAKLLYGDHLGPLVRRIAVPVLIIPLRDPAG